MITVYRQIYFVVTFDALFWLNTRLPNIIRNKLKKANPELTIGIGK